MYASYSSHSTPPATAPQFNPNIKDHIPVTPLPPPVQIDTALASRLGLTEAAARSIQKMREDYTDEICIIDNSASTKKNTAESHGIVIKSYRGKYFLSQASIWDQINQTVVRRANAIKAVGAGDKVSFSLLNDIDLPTKNKLVRKGFLSGADHTDLISANHIESALKDIKPYGSTPLVQKIEQLTRTLRERSAHPEQINAHITFFTDGIPTDDRGELPLEVVSDALKNIFRDIKATVVIHIATSDQSVIDFYNQLDQCDIENLVIDVMVDLQKEQAEIDKAGNNWFKQTEAGEIFRTYHAASDHSDNLDEDPLNLYSIKSLIEEFYGINDSELPDPMYYYQKFLSEAKDKIEGSPKSWGVVKGRLEKVDLIDPSKFPKPSGVSQPCQCIIM